MQLLIFSFILKKSVVRVIPASGSENGSGAFLFLALREMLWL